MKFSKLVMLASSSVFIFASCGKKGFSANSLDDIKINLPSDIQVDLDDDGDTTDPENCPRYDLVLKSVHTSNPQLNYTFKFNGEVKQTATQGITSVQFHQDSASKKLTQCSGNYNNTTHSITMKPLKVVEALTSEVVIHHGKICVSEPRSTYVSIIDQATGNLMYDEQQLKADIGCEFEYSSTGDALFQQIQGLADSVVNSMAAGCNK